MGEYHIRGKQKLSGEIVIGGAKNAVLPMLAAVILNGGTSILHNCPRISDTNIAIEILRSIGCKVEFDGGTITVNSSGINSDTIPDKLVRKMRCSIVYLGAMLGKFRKVRIGYPGGCENFWRHRVVLLEM